MRIPYMAVWLAGCFALNGAEISIPRVTLNPGGTALAEIRYAAQTSQVAALQFDLLYDAANLSISSVAGPAATAAGKVLGSADVAPGRKRFLLLGFNQTALADGVIVSLVVSCSPGVSGLQELRLTDGLAADPNGNPIGLATIDGIVSATSAAQTLGAAVLGQVASGASWKTTLALVSVSPAPTTARLNFWGNDGQPLVLPLAVPGLGGGPLNPASSLDCTLDPGAMFVVETEAPDVTEPLVGWVELESSENVVGFAVFRSRIGPDRDAEAMLVLEQRKAPVFVLPYDNSGGVRTGIAIANQSPDSLANLTLLLRDEAGSTISTESMSLPSRGHTSFVAIERFPVLMDRRGTIEVRNDSGGAISVLGLRFNPSGSFTSVPVIAKYLTCASPRICPAQKITLTHVHNVNEGRPVARFR